MKRLHSSPFRYKQTPAGGAIQQHFKYGNIITQIYVFLCSPLLYLYIYIYIPAWHTPRTGLCYSPALTVILLHKGFQN